MNTELTVESLPVAENRKEVKIGSLELFLKELEKLSNSEEKIRFCLDFMRSSLSNFRLPRFRDFWESKKACLLLFQDFLTPMARSHLWAEYIGLSNEARQIKERLDEQSAFATEQIDLAIGALEKDLQQYDELVRQGLPLSFSLWPWFLEKKREIYHGLQTHLSLLNILAARINGLRKEVIKTEMRVRFKNQFFDRLSSVGDKVFPSRKEVIRKISSEFAADIGEFEKGFFQEEVDPAVSLFELNKEIKALQIVAKELTLDTHAFNKTRLQLSQCWDLLKQREKERKKEVAQKKLEFKKNFKLVMDKIKVLAEKCQATTFTLNEASKLSSEIVNYMYRLELGREEVRDLKDEVQKAKTPLFDRFKKEKEDREKELEEIQQRKCEKLDLLKKEIKKLITSSSDLTAEEMTLLRNAFSKQLSCLSLTAAEKDLFDELLKQVRDKIIEKKDQAMFKLSQDDKNTLDQLSRVLEEYKLQRQEIRAQVKEYRKALAGSGFDFEKAMRYQELMDGEETRLEKITDAIDEIERKIASFKT